MGQITRLSNCPVCGCPLDNPTEIKLCTACETPHHRDCWEYNEGCAIYGCTASAPTHTKLSETGKLHSITDSDLPDSDLPDSLPDSYMPYSDIPANAASLRSMTISPDRFVFNLMSETSLLINIIKGIRVLAPALILINGLVYWQSTSSMIFLLCVFVTALSSFLFAFAQSLFTTRIRFRPTSRVILRDTFLGPFHVKTGKVNMSGIRNLHIGTAIVQQGLEHREMLRLVIEYKALDKEILYLDLAKENISSENIDAFALLLRKQEGLGILKAPPPKAGLLQKRITAFDLHLSKAENPLGELQWYWERRLAIAIPYLILVPLLGKAASAMHFSALLVVLPVIILTALYSFFRPEELYNSIENVITGKKSYISPEPDPLMFYNEEENISKLSNFMTRVEESSFISLISEEEKRTLAWIIKIVTLGPLPLLILAFLALQGERFFIEKTFFFTSILSLSAILMPPCMVLFSMVGGAINRAIWNEEWAKGWLNTSRTALVRLDEHKENEHQKLLRQEELKQLAEKATKELTIPEEIIEQKPARNKES